LITNFKMPSSYTSYTMLAFGVTAFASGVHTLITPASFVSALALPVGSEGAVRGNALAAIAMGIYYTLSVVQENRSFYIASVLMRLVTTTVFGLQGGPWIVPAAWEGIGAVSTALALLLDNRTKNVEKRA
jgi:hypothetical protein